MKYQIHLTFDNKKDRNAWVELIHACMERMEQIEMEWDEK
jgi:hypothetical protein